MGLTAAGMVFLGLGFMPLRRAALSDHDDRLCAWCLALWLWTIAAGMMGAAYILIGRG
jgi:hypothetical protein